MISVSEAENIINSNLLKIKTVETEITKSYKNILKENILSDREAPPFDRVTMDGIAINFASWKEGNNSFKIQDTQKAGDPQITLKNKNECIEVMTGTGLPFGCNCVIRVEDISIVNNIAHIKDGLKIELEQNIHKKGSDYQAEQILVEKDTEILATHIGVFASVGKSRVIVADKPSVAIISTGDELVDLDLEIQPHQIRMSNSYALKSALKNEGFEKTKIFHIIDNKSILREKLENILNNFDVIILSGGVSMGKFDFIPEILEELKVKMLFHKISQRPGKPFWFGISTDNKPVFALPGNPVSTIVCFYRYVVNYLKLSLGYKLNQDYINLAEEYNFIPAMTCFLPVKVKNEKGILKGYPIQTNTSGDYASLVHSDGFIELKADETVFPLGYTAPFYSWKF